MAANGAFLHATSQKLVKLSRPKIRDLQKLVHRYRWPLTVVAVSTAAVAAAVPISGLVLHARDISGGLLRTWLVWDSTSYISIAKFGYQTIGDPANYIAFFPVFPMLIWLAHWLTFLDFTLAAFTVPLVASIACACLMYKLVLLDDTQVVAKRAVLFMFIFPTSFFLHIPYNESVFLALVLATFVAMREGRLGTAFIYAGLATGTREQGLALLPAIFTELVLHHRKALKRKPYLVLAAIVVPCLGLGYFLFVNYALYGSALHFIAVVRDHWYQTSVAPWTGWINTIKAVSYRHGALLYYLVYVQLAAAALGTIVAIYSLFRLRLSYGIYALFFMLASMSISYWIAVERYILVLFPMYIMFARISANRAIRYLLISTSAVLLLVLMLACLQYAPVY